MRTVPRIIKRLKKVFLMGKTRVVSRSIIRNQFPLPFRTYASRMERNLIYISISRIPPAHPVPFRSVPIVGISIPFYFILDTGISLPFRSSHWNLGTVRFGSGYWNLGSVAFHSTYWNLDSIPFIPVPGISILSRSVPKSDSVGRILVFQST